MSQRFLDKLLSQRLELLIPENKDNSEETLRKIERFKRNIEIFKMHHGFDGNGGLSMEKTGVNFGLTRESVRQISDKISSLLKMNKEKIPELKESLRLIFSMMPAKDQRIEEALLQKGLISKDFKVTGILNAAKIYGVESKDYKIVLINEDKFIVQEKLESTAKNIMSIATKHISHNGAVNSQILIKEVSGVSNEIKELYIKDLLNSVSTATWLDEKWVHFGSKGLNRFRSRLNKIFTLYKTVHIDTVYKVIKKNWKKGEVEKTSILPKEVMISYVKADHDLYLEGNYISSRVIQNEKITKMEKLIFDLISSNKKLEMREKELEDAIINGDTSKKYSFTQALNFSVLFDRKKWGLYGLSGKI